MPHIYRQNCKQCGLYYESPAKLYCSRECRNADPELKASTSDTRRSNWAQGKRWDISKWLKAGSEATRGKRNPLVQGSNNYNWKGDSVSYAGLHRWVSKNFGRPMKCDKCLTEDYHRYEWANMTGIYNRDRKNWMRLCVPCHRRYDARKTVTA